MKEESLTEGSVLAALEGLGAVQWGLVTTGQAQQIGIPRLWLSRLMERDVIERIRYGVYALPSATHGPLQDLQAAWLTTDRTQTSEERVMGNNRIVVSHISAANVHELGDLVASRHEFSAPERHQSAQQDVHFYRRELAPEDIILQDGLPVTSAPRTIADLASLHVDFDHLAQTVRDALDKGLVDFQSLSERLEPAARSYGYDDGAAFTDALIAEAGIPSAAASLIVRNLASVLGSQLEKTLDELKASRTIENFQKALESALPTLNTTYESALQKSVASLIEARLPNMEAIQKRRQVEPNALPSTGKRNREAEDS